MVAVTSLGTALRIEAIPHAHVHGIDGRFASSKRMVREQPPQSLGVDSSMGQPARSHLPRHTTPE
jgi:hypothetical protein